MGASGTECLPGEEPGRQAFDLAIHIGETIRGKRPINPDLGALCLSVRRGSELLRRPGHGDVLMPRLFQFGERL
jgi:hypothetical protein